MEDIEAQFNDAMLSLARAEATKERVARLVEETDTKLKLLKSELETAIRAHNKAREAFSLAMKEKLELLKLVT